MTTRDDYDESRFLNPSAAYKTPAQEQDMNTSLPRFSKPEPTSKTKISMRKVASISAAHPLFTKN